MINEENDLCITFTRDFKFRSHIYKIAQKGNKVLVIIKCTFKYLEPNIMRLLYGTPIYILEDMQTTEKIQRKAIKLIPSLKQYCYDERCPAWIYQVQSIADLGLISLHCNK